MLIYRKKKYGVTILAISGFLVANTVNVLDGVIKNIQKENINHMIFDCSMVRKIDSVGFMTLINFAKQCDACNGKLIITSLQKHIEKIFMVMRLHKVITVRPDQDDALINFSLKYKNIDNLLYFHETNNKKVA